MPAQAGIHLRSPGNARENLDSGLRRNNGSKSRLLASDFRNFLLTSKSVLRELYGYLDNHERIRLPHFYPGSALLYSLDPISLLKGFIYDAKHL